MWCLSELALMLGSCAGPPSEGFSAGTGGTGTCWREAHQGKLHVPRLHLPHRSRQSQEEAAWKACAIRTGELAAPSGSASEELAEELPRVARAGPVGGVPGAGQEEEWVGYTCPTLPSFPCRDVILH